MTLSDSRRCSEDLRVPSWTLGQDRGVNNLFYTLSDHRRNLMQKFHSSKIKRWKNRAISELLCWRICTELSGHWCALYAPMWGVLSIIIASYWARDPSRTNPSECAIVLPTKVLMSMLLLLFPRHSMTVYIVNIDTVLVVIYLLAPPAPGASNTLYRNLAITLFNRLIETLSCPLLALVLYKRVRDAGHPQIWVSTYSVSICYVPLDRISLLSATKLYISMQSTTWRMPPIDRTQQTQAHWRQWIDLFTCVSKLLAWGCGPT